MIQLPNGQFQITNAKTGAQMNVNAADLPKYGLQAPGTQPQSSGGIGDFLRAITQAPRTAAQGLTDLGATGAYAVDKYLLKDPNADSKLANMPANPGGFLTPQENQQEMQDIQSSPKIAGIPIAPTARLAAGLGALAAGPETELPFGLGALGTIGSGATSGALQELSQKDATPQSVGENAVVNTILSALLPGLANVAGGKIAEGTLGKGGKLLPQIEEGIGGPIQGSMEHIRDNIGDMTQPIRDQYDALIKNATGEINTADLKNLATDRNIWQKSGAPVENITNVLSPHLRTEAMDPTSLAMRDIINKVQQKAPDFLAHSGDTPEDALKYTSGQDFNMPLSFWHDILHNDIASRIDWSKPTSELSPDQKVMKNLYTALSEKIGNSTDNPAEYQRLNNLKQAAAQIKGYLAQKTSPAAQNASGSFWNRAMLPSALIGLLSGHLGGYGGVAAAMEGSKMLTSHPQVSLPISRTLQNGGVGNTLLRLLGIGASPQVTDAINNNQ